MAQVDSETYHIPQHLDLAHSKNPKAEILNSKIDSSIFENVRALGLIEVNPATETKKGRLRFWANNELLVPEFPKTLFPPLI